MDIKKVAIIVNKNWEVEPVLNALTHYELRQKNLSFPTYLNSPKDKGNKMKVPRAVWVLRHGLQTVEFASYCIQDMMFPDSVTNSKEQSTSNSKEKYIVLKKELHFYLPEFIISVGTASYPSEQTLNGSVTIGTNFFLYDGHPANPLSDFTHPQIGQIIKSNVNPDFKNIFTDTFINDSLSKFLVPPVKAPANSKILFADNAVTVSSVNITDYKKYKKIDPLAVAALISADNSLDIISVETTHGVVRLSCDCPAIFIAGIANRLGFYDEEATLTQRYVASFNMGVVLGSLLTAIDDLIQQQFKFEKN